MELLVLPLIFVGIIVAVCIGGISVRVKRIEDLLKENREAFATLDSRLHQINGTLIEIAALLKGQRPPS
jgi:hypothetical protein